MHYIFNSQLYDKNKTQEIPIMKKHGWAKDDLKIHTFLNLSRFLLHIENENNQIVLA